MKKVAKPDVVELINKMQEQIAIIDRKIDTLISKSSARPVEARPPEARPFQQSAHNQNQRVLHKAVCADCKKACEVPFKPSGERPVYCKDCFSKRKSGGPFNKARPDNRPRVVAPISPIHVNKPEAAAQTKKPAAKKKAAPKKKKK